MASSSSPDALPSPATSTSTQRQTTSVARAWQIVFNQSPASLLLSLSFEEGVTPFFLVILEAIGFQQSTLRAQWTGSLYGIVALAVALIRWYHTTDILTEKCCSDSHLTTSTLFSPSKPQPPNSNGHERLSHLYAPPAGRAFCATPSALPVFSSIFTVATFLRQGPTAIGFITRDKLLRLVSSKDGSHWRHANRHPLWVRSIGGRLGFPFTLELLPRTIQARSVSV